MCINFGCNQHSMLFPECQLVQMQRGHHLQSIVSVTLTQKAANYPCVPESNSQESELWA
jgi:hypothetical protein